MKESRESLDTVHLIYLGYEEEGDPLVLAGLVSLDTVPLIYLDCEEEGDPLVVAGL